MNPAIHQHQHQHPKPPFSTCLLANNRFNPLTAFKLPPRLNTPPTQPRQRAATAQLQSLPTSLHTLAEPPSATNTDPSTPWNPYIYPPSKSPPQQSHPTPSRPSPTHLRLRTSRLSSHDPGCDALVHVGEGPLRVPLLPGGLVGVM